MESGIELPALVAPQWSQAQAVAFEAACECLTEARAIVEAAAAGAEGSARAFFAAELAHLDAERKGLRLEDAAAVARVRQDCGAFVRRHRIGERRAA